jgi:hypothetical protein
MTDREFILNVLPNFRFESYEVDATTAWIYWNAPDFDLMLEVVFDATQSPNYGASGHVCFISADKDLPPWAPTTAFKRFGRDVKILSQEGDSLLVVIELVDHDLEGPIQDTAVRLIDRLTAWNDADKFKDALRIGLFEALGNETKTIREILDDFDAKVHRPTPALP